MTITHAHDWWSPYGAFELKSSYRKNMLKAMILVTALFATTVALAMLIAALNKPVFVAQPKPIYVDPSDFLPPPIAERPVQRVVVTEKPNALITQIEIVDDNTIVEDVLLTSRDEFENYIPTLGGGDLNGGGYIVVPPEVVAEVDTNKIFDIVEDYPVLLLQVAPKYPEIARQAQIEGDVGVEVVIDRSGNVIDARVVKDSGTNAGFEEAAIAAALQSKWRPAMQNKQPVKVRVGYPVKFRLK